MSSKPAGAGRQAPLWLFDLDNTLHDASHAIFPAINANMNLFIAQMLRQAGEACDAATVNTLRHGYWQRYGATLTGLMRHHGVRADDFLLEAHRFDDLTRMIRSVRGLVHLLKRLPGRKILLTNAPRAYSREVMRHLRLQPHFSRHIAIESMQVHRQLRPKPSRQFLRKLLAAQGVAASRCILVEDSVENLRAAKQLGMRTAWMSGYLRRAWRLRESAAAAAGMDDTVGTIGTTLLPGSPRFSRRPAYVDFKSDTLHKLARQAGTASRSRSR